MGQHKKKKKKTLKGFVNIGHWADCQYISHSCPWLNKFVECSCSSFMPSSLITGSDVTSLWWFSKYLFFFFSHISMVYHSKFIHIWYLYFFLRTQLLSVLPYLCRETTLVYLLLVFDVYRCQCRSSMSAPDRQFLPVGVMSVLPLYIKIQKECAKVIQDD